MATETVSANGAWVEILPSIVALAVAGFGNLFLYLTSRNERQSSSKRHAREMRLQRRMLLSTYYMKVFEGRLKEYPEVVKMVNRITNMSALFDVNDQDAETDKERRLELLRFLQWEERFSLLLSPEAHTALNSYTSYIGETLLKDMDRDAYEKHRREVLGSLKADIQFMFSSDDRARRMLLGED